MRKLLLILLILPCFVTAQKTYIDSSGIEFKILDSTSHPFKMPKIEERWAAILYRDKHISLMYPDQSDTNFPIYYFEVYTAEGDEKRYQFALINGEIITIDEQYTIKIDKTRRLLTIKDKLTNQTYIFQFGMSGLKQI